MRRLSDFVPFPSGPDRRAATVAAVVGGLFAATIGIGLGDQPPNRAPETDLSRPVYPETTGNLHFSHQAHAETSCTTCHAGATESREADDDLRPGMTVCADCHGGDGEGAASPVLSNCAGCHAGYDRTVDEEIETPDDWRSIEPAPLTRPTRSPDLRFDHARHVDILGGEGEDSPETGAEETDAMTVEQACQRCHGAADSAPSGGVSMPQMARCASCHAGAEAGAPRGACGDCHTTEPTSPSASREPADQEERQTPMKPAGHGADWLERHGGVARSTSTRCTDCHTERDCSSCHEEQQADPFAVHPPNFDSLHAARPRSNTSGCTDCHDPENFCASCHARSGASATPPDRPPSRRDVHPPNWTEPNRSDNHAAMARRNITECASCHTERDCATCHEQVDPHPPDFKLRCGTWLEADATPCRQCHGDVDRLREQCL